MPTKGKTKGNAGELKIAKFLTTLFESQFMRVPNSGAQIGGSNRNRRTLMDDGQIAMFKSDIIPPSHMQHLVIESKFYGDFPFHKLGTDHRIAQLDKWIDQTLVTLDKGDIWFVVVRINHKGSFVLFDSHWQPQFVINNYARYFQYTWTEFEPFFTANKDKIISLSAS